MGKAVLVCHRELGSMERLERAVRTALGRTAVDNIRVAEGCVVARPGLCLGVLNPSPAIRVNGASVLFGHLSGLGRRRKTRAIILRRLRVRSP